MTSHFVEGCLKLSRYYTYAIDFTALALESVLCRQCDIDIALDYFFYFSIVPINMSQMTSEFKSKNLHQNGNQSIKMNSNLIFKRINFNRLKAFKCNKPKSDYFVTSQCYVIFVEQDYLIMPFYFIPTCILYTRGLEPLQI